MTARTCDFAYRTPHIHRNYAESGATHARTNINVMHENFDFNGNNIMLISHTLT